jgi:hypothetical protein
VIRGEGVLRRSHADFLGRERLAIKKKKEGEGHQMKKDTRHTKLV